MSNPECETPDKCRITGGVTVSTAMYFPPIYDGHGNNLNPDRNQSSTNMRCHTCGKEWVQKS